MEITQSIRSKPLSPAVGEEVLDIDFSEPLEQEAVDALKHLLAERGMIFARGQDLSPEQQIELAERFGRILINPFFAPVKGYPQIAEVRKEPEQLHNIGEIWHTDNSFDNAPALGSLLYAREVPPHGGDTLFASMFAAYDALSDGLKKTLSTLKAVHSTAHIFSKDGKAAEKKLEGRILVTDKSHREAEHPVVVQHPASGRKALFVNPNFTTRFAGWSAAESEGLLKHLYAHAVRPEYQCRLRWEKGTFALWDNRSTWHYATNDYHGHRRVMHRIQIEGSVLH